MSNLPVLPTSCQDRFGGVAVLFVAPHGGHHPRPTAGHGHSTGGCRGDGTGRRGGPRPDGPRPDGPQPEQGAAWSVSRDRAGLGALYPVYTAQTFPYVVHDVATPPWFTEVAPNLPAGSTVLVIPFPSSGLVQPSFWQAQADLRYRVVGGFAFVPDPRDPTIPDSTRARRRREDAVEPHVRHPGFADGDPVGAGPDPRPDRESPGGHRGRDQHVGLAGLLGGAVHGGTGEAPVWSHHAWVWDAADRDPTPPHPVGPTTLADCTTASLGSSDPLSVPGASSGS